MCIRFLHVTSEYGHREEIKIKKDNGDKGKSQTSKMTRHRDDLEINHKKIIDTMVQGI